MASHRPVRRVTSRGTELHPLLGLALVLLLVAAGACGVSPEPVLAVERQAVIGGVLEPDSPAVGAILPVAPTCGEPAEVSPVTCTEELRGGWPRGRSLRRGLHRA
jgi:hypothetical protein